MFPEGRGRGFLAPVCLLGANELLQAVRVLRDADWLTPDRAMAWCRVLAGVSAIAVLAAVALSPHGLDPQAKPLGTDFLSFYAASRLAEAGNTAGPYMPAVHEAMEHAVLPGVRRGYYAFLYPPPFLLMVWPLALLPYLPALAAWLAAGLAPLLVVARRLMPPAAGLLPVLAYPAVLLNAGHGQNAFISAALFGAYAVVGDDRPGLAGACLGALVFKPHLGICVPVALLAARRWRALAGATASASLFMAVSWLVLGRPAWAGFIASTPLSRAMLEQGLNGFEKMQSAFAGIRLMGGGIGLAWAGQAVVMAAVLAALALVCARRPGARAEGALLAVGALLVAPGSLDYDLVIAGVGMAWLLAAAVRTGFLPWEKLVLLLAYALPLVTRAVAGSLAVPLGPPVLAALFWAVRRRARVA